MSQYSTAITYSTYDLFHVGHVRLFKIIKQHCKTLIVGVSTDDFNAMKGKVTVIPFAQRSEIVSACKYVDAVIAEQCWEQKRADIKSKRVDLFAMGDDWSGRFDDLNDLCHVKYFPRTSVISSTLIKARLQVR